MNADRKLPATVSAEALLDYRLKRWLSISDLPKVYLDLHQVSERPEQLYVIVEAAFRAELEPAHFLLGNELTVADFAYFDPEDLAAEERRRTLVYGKANEDFYTALDLIDSNYADDFRQAAFDGVLPDHWLTEDIADDLNLIIATTRDKAGLQLIDQFERMTEDYGRPFHLLGQAFPYRWWEMSEGTYEMFGIRVETMATNLWDAKMLDLIRIADPVDQQVSPRLFFTVLHQLAESHLPLADLINEMIMADDFI